MYTRLAGMLNEDKLWSMAGVLNSRCCLCTELKCYWTQLVFLWCTVLAAAKQKEGQSWNGRIYKAQSWLITLHFKETVCEWGSCWWPQPLGTVSEFHKHDLSEWLTLVLQWWASQCFPFTSCYFPTSRATDSSQGHEVRQLVEQTTSVVLGQGPTVRLQQRRKQPTLLRRLY